MPGRRRGYRYRLGSPVEGTLQTVHDVLIEEAGEGEFVAFGESPVRRGTRLILTPVEGPGGRRREVTVLESVPLMVEGEIRYRLRLAMVDRGRE